MNNVDTFTPHKPEEMVVIEVTKREALAIQEIRQYSFGKIVIYKQNNLIIRLEPNQSKIIDDRDVLTIPIVRR